MKNRYLLLFTCFLLGLSQITCKKPTDKINLKVKSDIIKNSVLLNIDDPSEPGKKPANITIEITGEGADCVYELAGKKKFSVNDGTISLGLDPACKPTNDIPVKFNIIAKAPGYLTINIPVTIGGNDTQQIVNANMINLSDAPAGVWVVDASKPISAGTSTSVISVKTPLAGLAQEFTEVRIPAGTDFMDANGNKINGSNLKMNIAHFDTRTDASLSSFPGGFAPDKVIMKDGSEQSVSFMSAGFANIDMSINGTEVKQFSKDVEVTMAIDEGQMNPETNQPVQVGDTIPLWSYEVKTGVWKYEKMGTVELQNGKTVINFTTRHLTCFNIDYFLLNCYYSFPLTLSCPNLACPEYVICDIYDNNWVTHPHKTYLLQVYNGMVLNFLYAPKGLTRFEFYALTTTNYFWWMFQTRGPHIGHCLVNLCNGPATCILTITPRPVVNIDFYGVCPNRPNLQVRPSFWMFFKKASDSWYQVLGFVNNGRISTPNLQVGQTYDFGAWYGGVFISVRRTITTANYVESVQLSQGICDFF